MSRRSGITLLEFLVVVGILSVLLALLLSAVVMVREAALAAQSKNQLRQIALATHEFADAHHDRLPSLNGRGGFRRYYLSVFGAILPYIEGGTIAQQLRTHPGQYIPVKMYLSPADPTLDAALAAREEVCSYAANAQVFMGNPRLPTAFPDGTSNTIAFAEHYAFHCGAGSFYTFLSEPGVGYVPLHRATFADFGDTLPVTSGNPPVSGPEWPGDTFQVAPALDACKWWVPQTPHRGGMLVALGDGSVRTLARGMSLPAYWGAVTPAGGEILGSEW
jgi:type II secretory pathway pseudopilin PulG